MVNSNFIRWMQITIDNGLKITMSLVLKLYLLTYVILLAEYMLSLHRIKFGYAAKVLWIYKGAFFPCDHHNVIISNRNFAFPGFVS